MDVLDYCCSGCYCYSVVGAGDTVVVVVGWEARYGCAGSGGSCYSSCAACGDCYWSCSDGGVACDWWVSFVGLV